MFIRRKTAASVIEYTMMIVVVIAAMLVMQKYFLRAIAGRWKTVGESFGFGRQYDPQKTTECAFYTKTNIWYDVACADGNSCTYGNDPCYTSCVTTKCND